MVAQLGFALGDKGEDGLLTEHGVALLLGLGVVKTVEPEHAGDVLAESLAYGHRGSVVVEIVVFLLQGKAALRDVHDVHAHILGVGAEV